MADVTIRAEDELPTAGGGAFKLARDGLGISAWGMQILELPPNADRYPDHDHSGDGQEECYIAIEGSAEMRCGEESFELRPGILARVGPGQKRKLVPGDEGFKVLVIGGTPGRGYEIPDFTRAKSAG